MALRWKLVSGVFSVQGKDVVTNSANSFSDTLGEGSANLQGKFIPTEHPCASITNQI